MGHRPRGNETGRVSLARIEGQQRFLAALARKLPTGRKAYRRAAIFAGRQGGKTKIGGLALTTELAAPNVKWWAGGPTYDDLHDFVMPAVFESLPEAWIDAYSAEFREITTTLGSTCTFRSFDDPEKCRGPALHGLWMDEARKIVRAAWHTAMPSLNRFSGQAIITTSPNGQDWCYEDFWLPALQGKPGYWAVRYKSTDNPTLDQGDIALARAAMDPRFAAQEYDADFVTFTGAVFGPELPAQICRTPDQIMAVWPDYPKRDPTKPAWAGLDPGTDHPFGGVLAFQNSHGLIVCGEYLERDRGIDDHVQRIRQMVYPFEIERWGGDRSARQTWLEFALRHKLYVTPAENDVENGIRLMQAWMMRRRIWFIAPMVPKTVEQLLNWRYADNTTKTGESRSRERVIKRHDELPDCVRYMLQVGPSVPEPEEEAQERSDLARLERVAPDQRWEVERMLRCGRIARGEEPVEDDELESIPDEGDREDALAEFYG